MGIMVQEEALVVQEEAFLRVRIAANDAHYGGGLVAGAKILELFGDLVTEITIRHDGDEGLLRAYEGVEFFAPVGSGDYIEARGRLVVVGNSSRRCELEAYKVIAAKPDLGESAAEVLDEPQLVCKAVATTVVMGHLQNVRAGQVDA
jgi:3-aminobutyryl-CoA ammonia-lyase